MQIKVRVVPGAKRDLIKNELNGLKIYLTAPAVEGKANKALIQALAEHYKIKKNQIEILRGLVSRDKIIQIPDLQSA